MHYPANAFVKNSRKPIIIVPDGKTTGQFLLVM